MKKKKNLEPDKTPEEVTVETQEEITETGSRADTEAPEENNSPTSGDGMAPVNENEEAETEEVPEAAETAAAETEVETATGEAETEPAEEEGEPTAEEEGEPTAEELLEEAREIFREKVKALEEQNLRIRAEFANYKKRVEREQQEFATYIKGEMIKKLLPVVDDFKSMLERSEEGENERSVLEGARLIYEKLVQILEKEGLQKIDALGQPFDPQIHEALMLRPTEDKEKHDTVVEVFQEGFMLKDKLLRPSKVVVGKFEEPSEDGSSTS